MSTQLPVRVVKVGCSLFERQKLPEQLRAWLCAQPPAVHILIAGGGELADRIGVWCDRFHLSAARCHWLCIESLSVTAQILQQAMSDVPLVREFSALVTAIEAANQPTIVVFDLLQFLRDIEPKLPPAAVPHGSDVTTDSLAARLCEVLGGEELILLKSKPVPGEALPLDELYELNYVDAYLPQLGSRLKQVTLMQLQSSGPLAPVLRGEG